MVNQIIENLLLLKWLFVKSIWLIFEFSTIWSFPPLSMMFHAIGIEIHQYFEFQTFLRDNYSESFVLLRNWNKEKEVLFIFSRIFLWVNATHEVIFFIDWPDSMKISFKNQNRGLNILWYCNLLSARSTQV